MGKKFVLAAVTGCIALLGSVASAGTSPVEQGKSVYESRCLHCHGENANGKGLLIEHLKVTPADLTMMCMGQNKSCVTDRVLKAVLGRHEVGGKKMPLLKDYLSVEEVYQLSEYLKTKVK